VLSEYCNQAIVLTTVVGQLTYGDEEQRKRVNRVNRSIFQAVYKHSLLATGKVQYIDPNRLAAGHEEKHMHAAADAVRHGRISVHLAAIIALEINKWLPSFAHINASKLASHPTPATTTPAAPAAHLPPVLPPPPLSPLNDTYMSPSELSTAGQDEDDLEKTINELEQKKSQLLAHKRKRLEEVSMTGKLVSFSFLND
jgi:hypothetical protein